jgi:hypothetical protein
MKRVLGSAPRSRWLRSCVLSLFVAFAGSLLLGGSPAVAAGEAHPFLFSFGSFTNPNGVAVEESTGDVYVADIGTNTVYKFSASGEPVNFSALGSNALTGTLAGPFSFPNVYGTPAQVAVDDSTNPSDPSRGDLYVMDAGHGVIDKFAPSGAYLSQMKPLEGELMGFGLDANGTVRASVRAFYAPFEEEILWVDLFDNSAANGFVNQIRSGEGRDKITESLPMSGFAVGPSGESYPLFETCGCVERYGSGTGELIGFGRVDSGPGDVAMAVDPVSGHLYVDRQSSVVEWDTGGMDGYAQNEVATAAEVSSFGSQRLSPAQGLQQGGIAVNGVTGQVYVANPADGKVYVFASTPPAVVSGAAANVTQTGATLQGRVDPRRVPVTSCEFEYEKSPPANSGSAHQFVVPVVAFAHSVGCAQQPGQIGSGSSPVEVSAVIGGLEPAHLYYFRLTAGNASGTSSSEGMFATGDLGYGMKSFSVAFLNADGTPDTQAGSHPYHMVISFGFNTKVVRMTAGAESPYWERPVGNPKEVWVTTPPGLAGNPNATETKCTIRELNVANSIECPSGSQVGEIFIQTTGPGTGFFPLYNIVPPEGIASQLGTVDHFPSVIIDSRLQSGGLYPIESGSVEIPAIEPLLGTTTTLNGVVGSGFKRRPFLTLPTGCTGPLRSTIKTDSYQDPAHYVEKSEITRNAVGEPVFLSGCSRLEFPPTLTVAPDVTDASSSSGLTVGVHMPQKTGAFINPDGLVGSALRDTTVALPAGVALNPSGGDGLRACAEGQAGFEGFKEFNREFEPGVQWATFTPKAIGSLVAGVSFCPQEARIGTVRLTTPLVPNPLEGAVYVGSQNENPFGSLIAMYMMIEDPVAKSTVKLAGEVVLCESVGQVVAGVSCQAPGQIITTFKNTPDLPFEDLELHFFGGERAPLSTPSRCGTYTTQAIFTPWDGNAPLHTTSSFQITSGPNGSACPGQSLPFTPTLTAGTSSNQAGGFSPFTLTMSREDGNQDLQSASLTAPPGLAGLLTGVELCPETQANAGACGPNSLIGETTISVGVGNDPFTVRGGRVYLTGPYKGAPFGLAVVNPAKAGPYDVEHDTSKPATNMPACDCIVVRARVEVDPVTAGLTVTSDNEGPYEIPTMLDGIPLQIKHVNVTINRPRFTFNPTNCNPMSITGTLHSTEGATGSLALPFQVTNCAHLSFKPRFEVSTSDSTSRANGASLHVKLAYPKLPFGSQANIASVKVDLPKQLPSRLTTLQKACRDSVFAANPAACPAASKVGSAKAITPLIPVPLQGPAYFVSHGGAKFPELIVVLQGYGVRIDLHGETFIDKEGITSSTFHTIPDQPVGNFELTLPQGPDSALAANGNLCSATRTILLKKRIKVRGKGHTRTVTRKLRKTISGLLMPTAFTAQNGAVIHQNTPIEVTGCTRHKTGRAQRHKTRKGKG